MIEYESLFKSNERWLEELQLAASKVLKSGWYILGEEVKLFEEEFARYHGVKHCIGVGNGLDALILSIEALGLPKNAEILVASNTYIATIIAIIRAGFKPVLVEPDPETFNIDPSKIEVSITRNTKAICITHLYGKPCRMDKISAICNLNGLRLIEDCAQSHGAEFNGQKTGTFGDAGCFSFYPTKNLGGIGDGGAVITDDDNLAEKLFYLRNYGSKRKYENQYLGFNSRLDELQAAFLRIKLRSINEIIFHKRNLANLYFKYLPKYLQLPKRNPEEFDVFHIYAIMSEKRDSLREWMLNHGIKTEIHYPTPPHKQVAMRDYLMGKWPISEKLHQNELSLPISLGHSENEILKVCEVISEFQPE